MCVHTYVCIHLCTYVYMYVYMYVCIHVACTYVLCIHVRMCNIDICFIIFLGIIIRLVGSSLSNKGRVEVNYNGEWGTVCDDGWDDADASVVCRQLGFGLSGTATGSAGFGQGSGSIWLDSVMCTGSESTLASCGHLGVGITSCNHSKDAGVACSTDRVKGIIKIGYKYYQIKITMMRKSIELLKK